VENRDQVVPAAARREYIPVGSTPASLRATAAAGTTWPLSTGFVEPPGKVHRRLQGRWIRFYWFGARISAGDGRGRHHLTPVCRFCGTSR